MRMQHFLSYHLKKVPCIQWSNCVVAQHNLVVLVYQAMSGGPGGPLAMREPERICAVSGTIRENLNDREGQLACTYSSHLVHTWDLFIHTKGSSIMKSSIACKYYNICRQVDNFSLSGIKILSWYNKLNISCIFFFISNCENQNLGPGLFFLIPSRFNFAGSESFQLEKC